MFLPFLICYWLGYWKFLCTNFNNQSGINIETLKNVKIPLPPLDIQRQLAQEMKYAQERATYLRLEAEKQMTDAEHSFEQKMLG